MKTIAIILGTAIVLMGILYVIGNEKLGASNYSYDYYSSETYGTSSIPMSVSTPTSSIFTIYSGAGYTKSNIEVCNTQTNHAWLYAVSGSSASTSTMAVGRGVWLDGRGNTTSTVYSCRTFVNLNGDIRGIAITTTTVEVRYIR